MTTRFFFSFAFTFVCAFSLLAQDGVTASGVKYTVLKPGTGPTPKAGQEVLLQIEALDKDGNIVFSTREMNLLYHGVVGQETDPESKAHDEVLTKMNMGATYREEFPNSLLPADHPDRKEEGGYQVTIIEIVEVLDARASGTDLIAETANKSGIAEAETLLKSLQQSNPKGYTFYEWDMNAAGYKAMRDKKFDIAVAIFKMNTMLHPKSWNAYDSLGDAYLAKEESANAKTSFQKALQLNPKYTASQNKLNILNKM